MMNKLFNWTFGSFFRTLGRFMFYILIGMLLSYLLKDVKLPSLFNVLDVYAYTNDSWFQNIENYGASNYYFINHTSSGVSWPTNQDRVIALNQGFTTNTESDIWKDYTFPSHRDNATIYNYGFAFAWSSEERLKAGYLYNINTYFCSSVGISATTGYFTGGTSAGNSVDHTNIYTYTNTTGVANYLNGRTPNDNLTNCVLYTSLYVPDGDQSWLNLKITNNSSISNVKLTFVGFEINELGIYTSTISNMMTGIVSSSGLATASSVNQVQSSVNQIQSEVNNVNDSIEEQTQQQQENHEETINTITDETAPNVSGLSNSAGWLPAGPVDSILNLPLSFLTNLNTNLSKSCVPVELPLPYINRNIQLPCLNSIYAQINGLSSWINTIGVIASAFILFGYLINLYKYIDDTLTFRENNYIDNWSGV